MNNINTIITLGEMPFKLKQHLSSFPGDIKTIGHDISCDQQIERMKRVEEYDNVKLPLSFFEDIEDDVLFIISLENITNATLSILEQMNDKNLHLLYIYPFMRFANKEVKMMHRIFSGVLQEYARSGLFKTFTLLSEELLYNNIPNITLLNKEEKMCEFISSYITNILYFQNTKILFGTEPSFKDINRIQTFGLYDMQERSINLFDDLEPDETHLMFIYPQEQLESDHGLLNATLSSLPEIQDLSFSIHSSPHPQQFCSAISRTSEKSLNI